MIRNEQVSRLLGFRVIRNDFCAERIRTEGSGAWISQFLSGAFGVSGGVASATGRLGTDPEDRKFRPPPFIIVMINRGRLMEGVT